jgi:hypothetical protein
MVNLRVWYSSEICPRLSRWILSVLRSISTVYPVQAFVIGSISNIIDEHVDFFLSLMTYRTKGFLEFLRVRSVCHPRRSALENSWNI